MTKRGEPLPINQALNRSESQARPRPYSMDGDRIRLRNGFPRWVSPAGDLQLPDAAVLRVAHRPQTPKDVPALGPEPSARSPTMTRAKTEQQTYTPWFAKAGAACSIVPISRFVGPNIFALKGGGYGCLFSLTGMDEEGLTDQELESRVRSIEGVTARPARRLLPVSVHPRHVGLRSAAAEEI